MIDVKDKLRHAKHAMSRTWSQHDGYGGWDYTPAPAVAPRKLTDLDKFGARGSGNHDGYNGFTAAGEAARRPPAGHGISSEGGGSTFAIKSTSLPKQIEVIRMGNEEAHEKGWVPPGKEYGTGGRDRNYVGGSKAPASSNGQVHGGQLSNRSMSKSMTVRVPNRVPRFTETISLATLSMYDAGGAAIKTSPSIAAGAYAALDFNSASGTTKNGNRSGYLGALGVPGNNTGADIVTGCPFGEAFLNIDGFSSGMWKLSMDFVLSTSITTTANSAWLLVQGTFATLAGSNHITRKQTQSITAGLMQHIHFDITLPLTSLADCPMLVFFNGGAGACTVSLFSADITAMKMGDL